ncbi:membrane integrity-associated transporter subunit PqiC [Thioalkalivibrio sp.]|uniref:PqiC family protein n=1 Tax=Thioalkalivibrio sp. TaxID=2093813 RepID=UPI003974AA40
MNKISGGWVALALLVALGSGCTLVPERPALDRAWFLLEVPEAARAEQPGAFIELSSVRIAPAFAAKGLVYRLGPYRYESDFYNEWFLSPREHVEQLLRERWTRAGGPVTLIPDASTHPQARQLDILITALHGDLHTEGRGVARVGLRAFVQGREDPQFWELEQQVELGARTPQALVAALSSGMAALLEDLEQRLGE